MKHVNPDLKVTLFLLKTYYSEGMLRAKQVTSTSVMRFKLLGNNVLFNGYTVEEKWPQAKPRSAFIISQRL